MANGSLVFPQRNSSLIDRSMHNDSRSAVTVLCCERLYRSRIPSSNTLSVVELVSSRTPDFKIQIISRCLASPQVDGLGDAVTACYDCMVLSPPARWCIGSLRLTSSKAAMCRPVWQATARYSLFSGRISPAAILTTLHCVFDSVSPLGYQVAGRQTATMVLIGPRFVTLSLMNPCLATLWLIGRHRRPSRPVTSLYPPVSSRCLLAMLQSLTGYSVVSSYSPEFPLTTLSPPVPAIAAPPSAAPEPTPR